jgi:hypothetical protein
MLPPSSGLKNKPNKYWAKNKTLLGLFFDPEDFSEISVHFYWTT